MIPKKFLWLLFLAFTAPVVMNAQSNGLDSLEGYKLEVYYSKGHGTRALEVGELSHKAMAYYSKLLHFTPSVRLLVLAPADWAQHTDFPVYGMPHFTDEKTLVVAAENNDLWKSFIPPLEQLPPALAAAVRSTYHKDGLLTMEPFFDLLALHELGHAYHQQGGLTVQRKWMGELFCNIFLHTYVAEKEPARLQALTVFPNMVISGGSAGYRFTSLDDFEKHYEEIGTRHPKNYGWYQSRLHKAAADIYDAGGKDVLPKLWEALKSAEKTDDKSFAARLAKYVHRAVGDVWLKW